MNSSPLWARKDKTGIVFDSSTLFTFPNGAKRSPGVSWVLREKWDALSDAEKEKIFAPRSRFRHRTPLIVGCAENFAEKNGGIH